MTAPTRTVRIRMEGYLQRYLIHLYGGEGYSGGPITFPRKNDYNRLLINLVCKPPKNFRPDTQGVEITLRRNNLKNVDVYNYLSRRKKRDFIEEIRKDFRLDFKRFVSEKLDEGYTRKSAIIIFMETYRLIEDENLYDALYRRLSRMLEDRRIYASLTIF